MAKSEGYKKGLGSYSGDRDSIGLTKPAKTRDSIDRHVNVDTNSERSDGYAAKLTPSKE